MKRPTTWSRIRPTMRYTIILTSSLAVSVAGLILACLLRHPDYASRAGAISTVIGNGIILASSYGTQILEYRIRSIIDRPETHVAKPSADAITTWLSNNSNWQTYQNRALVIAAIIGTIFWGFGDLLAIYIMHSRGITPLCSC